MYNTIVSLSILATAVHAGTNGTTFFIVGDYGTVTDMTTPNFVFDAIDKVAG